MDAAGADCRYTYTGCWCEGIKFGAASVPFCLGIDCKHGSLCTRDGFSSTTDDVRRWQRKGETGYESKGAWELMVAAVAATASASVAATSKGRGYIHVRCTLPERRFIVNNCANLIRILPYRNPRSVSSGPCFSRDRDLSAGCRANINLNGFSTPLPADGIGI